MRLILALCLAAAGRVSAQEAGLDSIREAVDTAREQVRALQAAPPPPAAPAPKDICAGVSEDPTSSGKGEKRGVDWAEGGYCLPYPLTVVWNAASTVEAMTWAKVVKLGIASSSVTPANSRRFVVEYEAREFKIWCHTALWSMEWAHRVLSGDPASPKKVQISYVKLPGANWEGGFIHLFQGTVVLEAAGPSRTLIRTRYEVKAPHQSPDEAEKAVLRFLGRLKTVASGGALAPPPANPRCP